MGTKDLTHEAIAVALSSGQPLTHEQRGVLLGLVADDKAWQRRYDALTAQLREMDARYMALLKAVADGVAMQRPASLVVTSWTCSKCQTDRLKAPCPLGTGAQADGRCPCVGAALGA